VLRDICLKKEKKNIIKRMMTTAATAVGIEREAQMYGKWLYFDTNGSFMFPASSSPL